MNGYIKKTLLQVTLVSATIFIASCGNNVNPEYSKDFAAAQKEIIIETNRDENDARFLVMAAEMNLKEIQLGQLAQQNGNTQHVKELGKMMEAWHTKSLNDLTALAQNKMIVIPNAPTEQAQNVCNTLNEKTGVDFDKAYVNMMVNEHQDAIATYENAAKECTDSNIKNLAATTLPALRAHLDHSKESKYKCDKM